MTLRDFRPTPYFSIQEWIDDITDTVGPDDMTAVFKAYWTFCQELKRTDWSYRLYLQRRQQLAQRRYQAAKHASIFDELTEYFTTRGREDFGVESPSA